MADRRIAREQLDRKFTANPAGALAARPKFGWLRAVRDSLGMTTAQLAVRAGSPQQPSQRPNRANETKQSNSQLWLALPTP